MQNKWVVFLMVLFMGYSFLHQKNVEIFSTDAKKEELTSKDNELLETIKNYVRVITADPNAQSLTSKDKPLIVDNDESKSDKDTQKDSEVSIINANKEDKQMTPIQNKIANVIYNVLHTKQGQALVDKILTTPKEDEGDEKTLEPNPYLNNSILNVLEGEGSYSAECGDTATIHYITRLVSGQQIENTYINNKPKTFQIGDRKVIKGIEYAVIGMKKGGIRRLVIPPRLAYTNAELSKNLVGNNEFVTLDIELINIKPSLEDWTNKINIFQKPDENEGAYMLCSNEVYFYYKLSNTHEKVLLESKEKVHFTIGSSQVPPAINKAFSGIRGKAKRIVMLPSSLLYNQNVSFFPKNFKIPPKEMLILEINTGLNK